MPNTTSRSLTQLDPEIKKSVIKQLKYPPLFLLVREFILFLRTLISIQFSMHHFFLSLNGYRIIENTRVSDSNPRVSDPNPRVSDSNPRVSEEANTASFFLSSDYCNPSDEEER
jgi:hypothetical protein